VARHIPTDGDLTKKSFPRGKKMNFKKESRVGQAMCQTLTDICLKPRGGGGGHRERREGGAPGRSEGSNEYHRGGRRRKVTW